MTMTNTSTCTRTRRSDTCVCTHNITLYVAIRLFATSQNCCAAGFSEHTNPWTARTMQLRRVMLCWAATSSCSFWQRSHGQRSADHPACSKDGHTQPARQNARREVWQWPHSPVVPPPRTDGATTSSTSSASLGVVSCDENPFRWSFDPIVSLKHASNSGIRVSATATTTSTAGEPRETAEWQLQTKIPHTERQTWARTHTQPHTHSHTHTATRAYTHTHAHARTRTHARTHWSIHHLRPGQSRPTRLRQRALRHRSTPCSTSHAPRTLERQPQRSSLHLIGVKLTNSQPGSKRACTYLTSTTTAAPVAPVSHSGSSAAAMSTSCCACF